MSPEGDPARPSPRPVEVAQVDLDALPLGSRTRVRWPIAPGMLGDPVAVPVEVLVGRARRPRVALVAGVHGNEMEGILALHELGRALEPTELAGTLIVVPVANPAALAAVQRRVPVDAADLNRVFPGRADGSFSERLAATVFGLVRGTDFLYSLHSWGAEGEVVPYLEFPEGDDPVAHRSLAVGRMLGFDLLRTSAWRPGLLVAAAVRAGVPAVEAEIGGLGIGTPAGQELYRATLGNLLRGLGLLPGRPAPAPGVRIVRHVQVRADAGGLLVPDVELRQEIRAGDRLGAIVDPFGEPVAEVVAPIAGLVAARRRANALHPGDVAFTLFVPV